MSRSAALQPLRHAAFRWFWAGRAVSLLGSGMAPVALAFAVLDVSDSAAVLGLVLAARSIPMVGFLLLGGVVADRFSRSTVLVWSHLTAAASQGAVALLVLTGTAEIWMIVVLEAVNGTVYAFTWPALQGTVPMLVRRESLQQANALLGFARQGAMVIGPSSAGVLVVTAGSGWALAVDALTWAVAAGCLSRLHLPAEERTASTSMLHDLRAGWGAFASRTWVWVVVAAFGAMNIVHAGAWLTLGPVIARDTIGADAWGLVLAAQGVGFLLMTLLLLRLTPRFPLRAGMIGMLGFAAPLLVLGISPGTVLLVATAALSGAGMELFGIGWETALQTHVPGELLGRVASYDALGSFVAIPVGQLLAGPLAAVVGTREVVVGGAVLYLLVVLAALGSRSVRDLESVRAPAAQPGG